MKCPKSRTKIAVKYLYLLGLLVSALIFNINILYAQEAVDYVEVEEVLDYAVDEAAPAVEEVYEPPYVETNNTRTYFIISIVVLLFAGIICIYFYFKKHAQNSVFSSHKIRQICPKCGTVNPEGSLFCQNCGTKLGPI